jgi:hypothetical protein
MDPVPRTGSPLNEAGSHRMRCARRKQSNIRSIRRTAGCGASVGTGGCWTGILDRQARGPSVAGSPMRSGPEPADKPGLSGGASEWLTARRVGVLSNHYRIGRDWFRRKRGECATDSEERVRRACGHRFGLHLRVWPRQCASDRRAPRNPASLPRAAVRFAPACRHRDRRSRSSWGIHADPPAGRDHRSRRGRGTGRSIAVQRLRSGARERMRQERVMRSGPGVGSSHRRPA